MGRSTAVALIMAVALAGCTIPPRRETPGPAAPFPAASQTAESSAPASDIRFRLLNAYEAGERIAVRIENVGEVAYRFQPYYQACFLSYFDPQGREFIIPPGTHCDILGQATIRPGETERLFLWDLDECIRDSWGCVRSKPLDPGIYTIRGTFHSVGEGSPARAEVTFEVQGPL